MAKNILLVDDDINLCKVFKRIIEGAGYTLHVENTAKGAIANIKKTNYALALLDIQLPDMLGTEMLKAMHKMKPKLIKIMVTGDNTLANAVDSLNRGASAYLMKPTTAEQLLNTIAQALKKEDLSAK